MPRLSASSRSRSRSRADGAALAPRLTRGVVALVVALVVAVPVAWAVIASLRPVLGRDAWIALVALPGVGRAWSISVVTALVSTVIAALLTWHIAARWLHPAKARAGDRRAGDGCARDPRARDPRARDARAPSAVARPAGGAANAWLGPMLATPHAAFAVGLMVLLAPAGWVARLLAWPLGWDAVPNAGVLVDSPLALGVVLVAKELPFLLWTTLSALRRPDARLVLDAADRQAALLGHAPASRWWLVHAPMHVRRLAWPLLAVLAYALSVVDVALVTGPTLPAPLAVLAWEGIVDPDPAHQAAGAAAAWLLVASLAALALAAAGLMPTAARATARMAMRGPKRIATDAPARLAIRSPAESESESESAHASVLASARDTRPATTAWRVLIAVHVAVSAALLLASVAGPWPFPQLMPQAWTGGAWHRALESTPRIATSFALALAAATAGVLLAAAWLASTPARWDRWAIGGAMATVLLPSLLLSLGLYELALRLRLDGTHAGLLWAHVLFTAPYALLVLAGPWRGIDRRWIATARVFGHGAWSRLVRVQLPLLRAPLAAAWAVAFAVGIAQFLPTQLIGAGRITTLATEAVTLASAGQRNLAAATALLLALLPCAVFVVAARWRADRVDDGHRP